MPTSSKVTKSTLVKMLVEKGFSVRKARKGVNAVFEQMAQAAGRGEVVEVPGGKIYTVARKPRRKLHWFWNIGTNQKEFRMVQYNRGGKGIRFKPTLKLELKPEKEKTLRAARTSTFLREVRPLTERLLGRPVRDDEIGELITAMRGRFPKRDSFQQRLREVERRVIPPITYSDLYQWIREFHWI